MDCKTLFDFLSIIPEALVESYTLEKVETSLIHPLNLRRCVQETDAVETLEKLFMLHFDPTREYTCCKLKLKNGGFVLLDAFSNQLMIASDVDFPYLDILSERGFLGKQKLVQTVHWV